MKNRWNLLKKKYGQWKTLNLRATGLGRDPFTGYIVADDEWWVKQNKTMPGCICFKTVPLEHEEQIRIMFDAVVVTNETSYVPTTGGSSSHNEGDANVNADFDNPAPLNADRRAKKGLLLPLPRREKRKRLLETNA